MPRLPAHTNKFSSDGAETTRYRPVAQLTHQPGDSGGSHNSRCTVSYSPASEQTCRPKPETHCLSVGGWHVWLWTAEAARYSKLASHVSSGCSSPRDHEVGLETISTAEGTRPAGESDLVENPETTNIFASHCWCTHSYRNAVRPFTRQGISFAIPYLPWAPSSPGWDPRGMGEALL